MKDPTISIIVPCFNQAEYLPDALESVLNQNYDEWECIIVNDGSTDNTEEIAREYEKKNSRFKYCYQENAGLSVSRNSGIQLAKGDYILPLDADDVLGNNYILHALEEFKNDESLKLVYCNVCKFGLVDTFWNLPDFSLLELSKKNMIIASGVYKKEDWKEIGGYDKNMIYGWEDWEFWISLLKNGGNVKKIENVEFYYRIKSESMLNAITSYQQKYLFEYISIKHSDFFVELYGSFHHLNRRICVEKHEKELILKSKKMAFKLLINSLFGLRKNEVHG
ncbi:glycosyltransferase family 2 protein [Gillisia sp. M10.2A]|uniref:Glycosyltransferase family 2 protein n=1 Tax=Gillisia lutea TaxID=2909668 RepID=A0ABS9EGV1_9FLAO|nr:glycosyltransferase family A protein [Gillisia lutea]MCF4102117.1 glycosyltransferase family 2 protein [Gillisia lutea]